MVNNASAISDGTEKSSNATATPQPLTQAGVCLTFDDRSITEWEAMLPVFDKYNAHITFFVSGEIGEAEAVRLKAIEARGHAIGAHGLIHDHYRKCVENKGMTPEEYANWDSLGQMASFRKYGINIMSYACPMSSRDEKLDELLKPHFRHIRCGIYLQPNERLVDMDDAFVPIADVAKHFYFKGKGIDHNPDYTCEMVDDAMARAASRKELLVLYSHNIVPDPYEGHHVEPAEVERVLQKGQALGLRFYSFNELP